MKKELVQVQTLNVCARIFLQKHEFMLSEINREEDKKVKQKAAHHLHNFDAVICQRRTQRAKQRNGKLT